MSNDQLKWLYLIILSLIWGSSFILIKKGLVGLTDYQLGSLRIVLTSLILFGVGFKSLRAVKKKHWKWIAISGFVSSFFPPFLFAIAQNHISSAITSILNSMVPLNTVIIGAVIFAIGVTKRQLWGVALGFAGTLLLIYGGISITEGSTTENTLQGETNYWYSILVILATIGYAFNVNIIKRHLNDLNALAVTTGNFIFVFIPSLVILIYSGFFEQIASSTEMQVASGYVAILALLGTALAKVIFNRMVQISSPVFASSVTYTMPIVAVVWGLLDGEAFGLIQVIAAVIILVGVYLSNKHTA